MAIKILFLLIFCFTLIFTTLKVDTVEQSPNYTKVPNIIFTDAIMIDMSQNGIHQMIHSKQALNFLDRDELFDATITSKDANNSFNTIDAEYIVKIGTIYQLYKNVVLNQHNTIQLFSKQLRYNMENKIITNNTNFTFVQNGSVLKGQNLFFDIKNNIFKAKHTKFIIKEDIL